MAARFQNEEGVNGAPRSAALAWLCLLLEVLATFALPLVLVLLAVRNSDPRKKSPEPWYLPGKQGPDPRGLWPDYGIR